MRKQHVTDLLSNKISSTFLTFIENTNYMNSLLWECLIHENSDKRPCLVVHSGTHSYSTSLQNKPFISFLDTHQYDDHMVLLSAIRNWNSTIQTQNPNSSSVLFIESLSWFILDYSTEWEFEFWIQKLLMSLFELSSQSNIQRLVVRFKPIQNKSGHYDAGSIDIMKILESVSTSWISCGSIQYSNHQVIQELNVWHRRTVQGEWSKSTDNLFMFNKPAFTESGQIQLDPHNLTILNFLPHSKDLKPTPTEVPNPQSTFDLSLSESEKQARSRVVLPYEIPTAKSTNSLSSKPDECNIHYTPDCFDDLDEEDPDDDLDV